MTTGIQVRRVLIITLFLNFGVALGKIVVGLISGVLAITADGFHSLTDGSSNVLALVAHRIASRPPDDDHPYGHGRYETLAAMLIGIFLLLVAWEIITGAMERLSNPTELSVTPLTFAVMLITLCINWGVSRYERQAGYRLRSELLLADSKHTRADVWVTSSVIISMMLIGLTGWSWIDAVTAIIVVVLIGRAGLSILKQNGRILVDTAPYTPEQLMEIVSDIPQVVDVVRVRSRGTTDQPNIDIDITLPADMTIADSAKVISDIRQRLCDTLGDVQEVEVHFMPAEETKTA
ncbi:MAG: cation transporter [Phototrophicales bacterium]|jgi:cation diffusion facilitator family transporter|nr:MAG: cation transporter [Phototrophicales bacterium]